MVKTPKPKAPVVVPKPVSHVGTKTAAYDTRGLFDKDENDTEVDALPVIPVRGPVSAKPEISVKPLIPTFAPDPGQDLSIFPVSQVHAEQRLVSSKQPVQMAFAIIKGEAVEYLPDNDGSLRQLRVLGPGNLVNACLFEQEPREKRSVVEVKAVTELLVYRITEDDLEAHDVPAERRTSVRRNRERFLRAALANEASLIRSGRKQLFEGLRDAQAQAMELDGIVRSDIGRRVNLIKDQQLRPLKRQIAIYERWLMMFFGLNVPWLLKDRTSDTESVRRLLETLRTMNEDLTEDNETLYRERDLLYKTILDALVSALEGADSKLTVVDLLGRVNNLFGRKLKRPKSLL